MILIIAGLIVLLLGAQWGLRSFFDRHIRAMVRVSVGIVMVVLAMYTWDQFQIWQEGGLAQFLLPPYQSSLYFWGYVAGRIWGPYLLAGLLGAVIGYGAHHYNRIRNNQLFEPQEMILAPLCFFLMGWPGALVYGVVVLVAFVVASLGVSVIRSRHERISLYYFWLPAALFGILLQELVVRGSVVWNVLTF